MFRSIALLTCASACFAQSPADLFNRPPEDVDRALRARITEFYQDHVDGKFRQAEALVAEDSKDYFYNGSKTKYLSFEIRKINYSEGFTRAEALIMCEQYIPVPEFNNKPMKVPTPSYWKVVDGQWYWYVDQKLLRQSPFGGPMTPGPYTPGTAPSLPSSIPNLQQMEKLFGQQVKVDKTSVSLKAGDSEQITVTNGSQGTITIELTGEIPGVNVKLDKMDIPAGQKAVVTLRAGSGAKPGVLSLRVEQTNQVFSIQVSVS